jgi:nucleoside-diphosphate-sugar epimerase
MRKDAKIYIAGHRGMVGSAIWRQLKKRATATSLAVRMQNLT